jgi:hypothetical protein
MEVKRQDSSEARVVVTLCYPSRLGLPLAAYHPLPGVACRIPEERLHMVIIGIGLCR